MLRPTSHLSTPVLSRPHDRLQVIRGRLSTPKPSHRSGMYISVDRPFAPSGPPPTTTSSWVVRPIPSGQEVDTEDRYRGPRVVVRGTALGPRASTIGGRRRTIEASMGFPSSALLVPRVGSSWPPASPSGAWPTGRSRRRSWSIWPWDGTIRWRWFSIRNGWRFKQAAPGLVKAGAGFAKSLLTASSAPVALEEAGARGRGRRRCRFDRWSKGRGVS